MPVDYHAWTHRPKALGGTDPIEGTVVEFFRAVFWSNHPAADPITVSGTMIDIVYTDWENSAPSIFEPLTSGGAEPVMGTDLLQRVQLNANGRYIISWGVYFNSSFDGMVAQYISDNDPIFGQPEMTVHGATTYGGSSFNNTGPYTQTVARIYPLLDPFDSGSHIPQISTDASQNSGTNKTVTEAWLEIHYEPANV